MQIDGNCWAPHCNLDWWLDAVQQVGGYGTPSLQSWFHSQWLPPLWNISEACGWQVICSRYKHKASCHLQATDTWHQFHLSTLVPHNGYVEVWCAPSATMWHVLTYVEIKFLVSGMCYLGFLWKSFCVTAWGGVFVFLFCFRLHNFNLKVTTWWNKHHTCTVP